MAKIKAEASFKNSKASVKTSLHCLSFEEKGLHYIYSPDLDLYGYGKNEKEAQKSFLITLSEFLNYTINKGTLFPELKKLGWKITGSKKRPKFQTPKFDELLRDNEEFVDIWNKKEFKKFNQEIEIPQLV